ncbi:MAG TPA: hypothetical protein VFT99_08930, partial [Roseiflexaceae bacterium]|nr:hypothetical protein [Roseiflexaceae bacterium]
AILEGEPTPTLLHLERFYLSPLYRDEVLGRVVDRAVRDYWLVQVPSMPEKIKTSIDSLKRRLTGLVGSETGQRLLCQPFSTVDLPRAMRDQAIVIIKLVPERVGETNAAFWGAALFQSVVSATFSQQQEPDPDNRWDWPLFVDEVQVFVKAERADDAERMWTRTRSMGVGLVGAHQGLNQLGETLGGTVLNVLGGLCLTSGVRDDPRDLVLAYANQAIQPEDLAGLRAREELLIRFPVRGHDTGLFSAVPRSRPPEQSPKRVHMARSTERFQPASEEEAFDLTTLEALEQGVAQMLKANAELLPETVYRAVANEWVSAVEAELRQRSAGENNVWIEIAAIVERLRNASRRRAHHEADDLFERQKTRPAGDYLTQLSAARYGVDPLVNACYVATLVRRYPADERGSFQAKGRRRQNDEPGVAPPVLPGRPDSGR